MKKFFTIFVLLAIIGLSSVYAQNYFTNESYDLNDNLVPAGWTFNEIISDCNISSGKINALITDARGQLIRAGEMPANVDSVKFEWDGYINYAYWGMYSSLYLKIDSNKYVRIRNGYNDWAWGNSNLVQLFFLQDPTSAQDYLMDTLLIPFESDSFHYTVVINNSQIKFKANRLSDSTENFNITYLISQYDSLAGFSLANISEIRYEVGCTTDNDTWLDNPKITIYSNPNCLIAYYPFNGNANDASGNGNNAVVHGATLCADRFGNANSAYSLNGTSDFIEIPYTPFFDFSGSKVLSYSGWVLTNNTSVDQIFIGKDGNPYCQNFAFSTMIGIDCHTGFHCQPICWEGSSSYPFSQNTWNHIFVTAYNDSLKVYINGNLVDDILLNNIIWSNDSQEINLGVFNSIVDNYVYYLDGIIDDIRIYNCVLDSTEINTLYNEGLCYETITVTDTLIINAVITGYHPVTFLNTIKIYPNPTMDQITIDYGNYSTMSGYTLKITNSLGQTVFTNPVNQQYSVINLSTWTGNGVYFVYLIDAQSNIIDIKKIVLQ